MALRKNGEQFPCLLRASPIETDQGPAGLRGLILDVTERRRAEQAERQLAERLQQAMKLEAVGRLAGGVAHDFNNLLTTVLGYASLAQLSLEAAHPVSPMLAEIQRAAESGAQLTQHLLVFSRKQAVVPTALDLTELVQSMDDVLRRLLGENVELRFELATPLWPVFADANQCQQVLVNLAVNARDAMAEGGTLTIRSRNAPMGAGRPTDGADTPSAPPAIAAADEDEPPSGDEVWLEVTDDGVGMDAATARHIFEPFFTTKPRGRGTGLGLAMVYGAVRQHGGTVAVDSYPARGTTVTLRYPRWVNVEDSEEPTSSRRLVGGSERILVVEDEPLVREMVCRVLERLGYQVISSRDGAEALRAFAGGAADLDLLVTDVVMPGISGPDLAKRLVERSASLDVLFTSGHSAEVISRHGLRENGVHFLPKPYTPSQLARKIREILDSR